MASSNSNNRVFPEDIFADDNENWSWTAGGSASKAPVAADSNYDAYPVDSRPGSTSSSSGDMFVMRSDSSSQPKKSASDLSDLNDRSLSSEPVRGVSQPIPSIYDDDARSGSPGGVVYGKTDLAFDSFKMSLRKGSSDENVSNGKEKESSPECTKSPSREKSSSQSQEHESRSKSHSDNDPDRSKSRSKEPEDKSKDPAKKSRSREPAEKSSRESSRQRSRSGSRDGRRRKYSRERRSSSRERRSKRSRSRSREKRARDDRRRSRSRDRYTERSRRPDPRGREYRRRSRSYERRRQRRSSSRDKYHRRRYSRSRSRSRERSKGSTIRKPASSGMTPQMALAQTMAAMSAKAEALTGIALPKYYNPAAVNPLKYAEQVQKRKLLWQTKEKTVEVGVEQPKNTVWDKLTFAQDQDGRMTAKFRKLMGMKVEGAAPSEPSPDDKESVLKKQEDLFRDLDQQYEMARMTTHTQRGVGLGYSHQPIYPPVPK